MEIRLTEPTVDEHGPRRLIALAGRFDANEVHEFAAAVGPVLRSAAPRVGFDLTEVGFIDSSALAELIRVRATALGAGGDFELVAVSDAVRIILEVTDLAPVLAPEAVFASPSSE
jgi:anti-sigma B factor antagonist